MYRRDALTHTLLLRARFLTHVIDVLLRGQVTTVLVQGEDAPTAAHGHHRVRLDRYGFPRASVAHSRGMHILWCTRCRNDIYLTIDTFLTVPYYYYDYNYDYYCCYCY